MTASARNFATTDLGILLVGESGTGKELFAQAIHNESKRAGKPFIALNCAAFPESLLEAELFGHDEGAFTGARRGGRPGLLESAHTGTLLLDEIGDMPLALQTRLLRALHEREITRLGAASPIPIDSRVIAATHQPLPELIAQGLFRQDLYYRLNILRLVLPPLRERRDDIAPLIQHLTGRCLLRLGCRLDVERALGRIMPLLLAYHWPGNVRELENIGERMAVLLRSEANDRMPLELDELRRDCPELFAAPTVHTHPAASKALTGIDDEEIGRNQRARNALATAHGRHGAAAKLLGISRSTLWRWLQLS